MPELPEVETVRCDVQKIFAGCRLKQLVVTGRRTVRRHPAGDLACLHGRTLQEARRHGKFLLLGWDQAPTLVVHLRMSGQLLALPAGTKPAPHTHAVFKFARARELHFVDPRTFGELFLETGQLSHLGPDALGITNAQMAAALAGRRASVKAVLVDQRAMAGIGNIYADEICFRARVKPDRPAGGLGPEEVRRLTRAVRAVLRAAIAARGSSLRDQRYRDVLGNLGGYQLEHKVYGRAGLACPDCGALVQRGRFGAKSAFFCPHCQT